ncbi:MAG: hypothetical protein V8T46_08105 [Sutterella seckii]
MLAGDALRRRHSPSFPSLRFTRKLPRASRRRSRAAGVWGICGGQALDLAMVGEHPGEAEPLRMQAMKTGAMILASVLMGAQSGGWEKLGDGAKAGLVQLRAVARRCLPGGRRHSRLHAGYENARENSRQG